MRTANDAAQAQFIPPLTELDLDEISSTLEIIKEQVVIEHSVRIDSVAGRTSSGKRFGLHRTPSGEIKLQELVW